MTASILPRNATAAERAIEAATARAADIDAAAIARQWDAATCPAALLTWLAWAWNLDEWDATWPDERKRASIAQAVSMHRRKGTVASVRQVLINAGYGDATIAEGAWGTPYDGTLTYNGANTHGDVTEWARYRIVLSRVVTNAQAAQIRRLLAYTAPARCLLTELVYTEIANTYSGTTTYNGTYNHGTA